MKADRLVAAMAENVPPRLSAFSVTVFAAAIAIGAAVTYLGITGRIGGPIP